jgi:branched-chain amino acid transport system substrate-binding protein
MRRDTCQRLTAAKAMALALLMAAALTACGGGGVTVAKTTIAHGKHYVRPHVDIYAGLPLRGPMAPEGHAILNGIRLALAGQRLHPGDLHIDFTPLNDSGKRTGEENLELTATRAGQVATDPYAVYYIGDLGSAETAVSLPILSAAGIAQVTPGNPYVTPAALSSKLLRLLPGYTTEAAADVLFFREIPPLVRDPRCTNVLAVAQDDPKSIALVSAMSTDAKADGIQMPAPTTLTSKTSSLTDYQTALQRQSPAPCGFVIAAHEPKPAVELAKMIHSIFPHAFIVGTSGLCGSKSKWTRAVVHAIPALADSLLWCTSPVLPLGQYAGGDQFVKLYKSAHGGAYPSPYAFYGYEAAELGIVVVDDYLSPQGDNRNQMRDDLFDSQIRDSVFAPYGFLTNTTNSTLNTYGVYRVNAATAEPTWYMTLRPQLP